MDRETDNIRISNSYHTNGTISSNSEETSFGIIALNTIWSSGSVPSIYVSNCYVVSGSANNITCTGAKSDNTLALIQSQMKLIAEDLGSTFVSNNNTDLNNGYPVFSWQLESNLIGDINEDDSINIADAIMLQKWIVQSSTELTNHNNADMNSDSNTRQQHLLLRRNGRRVKKNIKKKCWFKCSTKHETFSTDTFILCLRNKIKCSFT